MTTARRPGEMERELSKPVVGGEALLAGLVERGVLNDGRAIDYAFGIGHGTYRGRDDRQVMVAPMPDIARRSCGSTTALRRRGAVQPGADESRRCWRSASPRSISVTTCSR